jgi:beta-glucosidase
MQPENKFSTKYLDSPNDPVYPFGYGLSYTSFEYGDVKLSKSRLKGDETLTVTVAVSNIGKYAGEEVVLLYIQDMVGSVSRPVKELKNFARIMLQPGEMKEVTFEVKPQDLMFYNSSLVFDWEPGDFMVHVGTNSRDVKSVTVNWAK